MSVNIHRLKQENYQMKVNAESYVDEMIKNPLPSKDTIAMSKGLKAVSYC